MTIATFAERSYAPGEVIFHEGDVSDVAYVVLSGEVEVYRRVPSGTVLLALLGEGEIFGEMGIVDACPRFASVAAKTACRLRIISPEVIAGILQSQPPEFAILLRALMERLRQASMMAAALADKQAGLQLGRSVTEPPPIHRITLLPGSDWMRQKMPAQGLVLQSLPFRVGGQPAGEVAHPLDWNQLCIQGVRPEVMARNHFMIHRSEEGLLVSDRGSRTGTRVNGQSIGGGQPAYRSVLKPGENVILAGQDEENYRFLLRWE